MVIFNHQFYDRDSFDEHQWWERNNDQVRFRRGDDRNLSPRLKDPRTGDNFIPTYALRTLFHSHPSRANIEETINHSINGITTKEINQFLPTTDDPNANTGEFVAQIRAFAASRESNQIEYNTHIQTLQNASASNSTPSSNRRTATATSTSTTTTSTSTHGGPILTAGAIASLITQVNDGGDVIDVDPSDSTDDSLFDASPNNNIQLSDSDGDDDSVLNNGLEGIDPEVNVSTLDGDTFRVRPTINTPALNVPAPVFN